MNVASKMVESIVTGTSVALLDVGEVFSKLRSVGEAVVLAANEPGANRRPCCPKILEMIAK